MSFSLPSVLHDDIAPNVIVDNIITSVESYNSSLGSLLDHLKKVKSTVSSQKSLLSKQDKLVGKRIRASNSKKLSLQQKKRAKDHFFTWQGRAPEPNLHALEQDPYKQKLPLQFNVFPWKEQHETRLRHSIREVNRERLVFDLTQRYMFDTRPGSAAEFRKEMKHLNTLSAAEIEEVPHVDTFPWDKVASYYNQGKKTGLRTEQECKHRYKNVLQKNSGNWSKDEDLKLRKLAKKYHGHHWDKVAEELGTNRSAFDCLSRYQRSLNTKMLKSKWTREDDEMLRLAVERYGEHNWQEVARHVGGRTGQQCLHRWMKAINPKIEHGKWNLLQDKKLVLAVHAYGEGNWAKICKHIEGRTDVQCRERWHNVLNPDVTQKPWTEKEDRRLNALIAKYKVGNWATIARHLGGRTDNQCWRRWKALNPEQALDGYTRRLVKGERMLPQNFVGREKDRSTLTMEDVEELTTSEDEDIDQAVRDRRSRKKRRRENSIFGNRIHPFLRDHWRRKVQLDEIIQRDPSLIHMEAEEIDELLKYLFVKSAIGDDDEVLLEEHTEIARQNETQNVARQISRTDKAPLVILPHQPLSKIAEDDEESRIALARLCNYIDSPGEGGGDEGFVPLEAGIFQQEEVQEFQNRLGALVQAPLLGTMEEFFGNRGCG